MKRVLAIIFALVLLETAAWSQFSVPGVDRPGRWMQIKTDHYRVIYKAGADSLAIEYAGELERVRPYVGASAGMAPVQFQKRKLPVILHTGNIHSNGSVTWTPKRMELYTLPQTFDAEPTPWLRQLSIHESRHVAQMQLGYRGIGKVLTPLIGEMWPGAVSALYPNQAFLEGDAVVAETALTEAGRGRTASFLNYYQAAFDEGDWRNWYRWRYGSFKYFSPDHYTLGYMTIGGARAFYSDSLFTKKYFDHVSRHPFSIGNLSKQMKKASGMPLRKAWRDIEGKFQEIWNDEAAKRGPLQEPVQITPSPSYATSYGNLVFADGLLYGVRSGKTYAPELVTISRDGSCRAICGIQSSASPLTFDHVRHRIYWSSTRPDLRWEMEGKTAISYYETTSGKTRTLTRGGRLFNPVPSEDGERIATVCFPENGGCSVVILNAGDGSEISSVPAPEAVQLTEMVWRGEKIYAIGVADGGEGIWCLSDGRWTCVNEPSVKMMGGISAGEDYVEFVCDVDGSKELYRMKPDGSDPRRLTSLRYGGDDYCDDGENMYFTSVTRNGTMVFSLPLDQLHSTPIDITRPHYYPVAETLSAQEKDITEGIEAPGEIRMERTRYWKFPHILKLHSWAPVYINTDNIEDFSFDTYYRTASLGVTGFFQNDRSTVYGSFGYSAHPDPDGGKKWMHSFHGKFTYAGLYPVLEAEFDIGDRRTHCLFFSVYEDGSPLSQGSLGKNLYARGSFSAYIPFNLSNGVVSAGIVPRVRYTVTNDQLSTAVMHVRREKAWEDDTIMPIATGMDSGRWVPVRSASASLRGYVMLPKAESQIYPRLGIGAEAGMSLMPSLSRLYGPSAYFYVYGYLPGFTRTQGFRLTALLSEGFGNGLFGPAATASTLPRGISDAGISLYRTQAKLSLDYAIPIFVGDMWWLSPVAYGRNFVLTPHADLSFVSDKTLGRALLWSAGADITVALANLLWIPFDFSIGVRLDYNGAAGLPEPLRKPFSASFIFDYDF
ncbi:MAG: hypothetical protein IKR69_05670 [Bacteroidales bacterium]|nr:hypothetical protein [Bacteroidales bacterium]